jgi:hypothetical protein
LIVFDVRNAFQAHDLVELANRCSYAVQLSEIRISKFDVPKPKERSPTNSLFVVLFIERQP